METITASDFAKTVGPVAAGPHGHGIFAAVTSDIKFDDNTQGVTAQVDKASVKRAKDDAEYKILSKAPPALRSRGSFSGLRASSAKISAVGDQYAETFAKRGLDKSINRVMSRAPVAKATASSVQPAPQQKGTPQIARIQSQLDSLDAMFKLMPVTKVIPVNGAILQAKANPNMSRTPADSRRRRNNMRTVLLTDPPAPRRLHTVRESFNIAATGQTADSHAKKQRVVTKKLGKELNASIAAAPSPGRPKMKMWAGLASLGYV